MSSTGDERNNAASSIIDLATGGEDPAPPPEDTDHGAPALEPPAVTPAAPTRRSKRQRRDSLKVRTNADRDVFSDDDDDDSPMPHYKQIELTLEQYQEARAAPACLPTRKSEFNAVNELELEPHMFDVPEVHPHWLTGKAGGVKTTPEEALADIQTVEGVQKVYLARLLTPGVLVTERKVGTTDPRPGKGREIKLSCWKLLIEAKKPVGGFDPAPPKSPNYQITPAQTEILIKERKTKRIAATRMPFINTWLSFDPTLESGNSVMTIDHFACHDPECLNPWHTDRTDNGVNKSRTCLPDHCIHDSKGLAKKCVIFKSETMAGVPTRFCKPCTKKAPIDALATAAVASTEQQLASNPSSNDAGNSTGSSSSDNVHDGKRQGV